MNNDEIIVIINKSSIDFYRNSILNSTFSLAIRVGCRKHDSFFTLNNQAMFPRTKTGELL